MENPRRRNVQYLLAEWELRPFFRFIARLLEEKKQ